MPVGRLGAPPIGRPTPLIGEKVTESPGGSGPQPSPGVCLGQAADLRGSDSNTQSVGEQAAPLSPTWGLSLLRALQHL